MRNSVKWYFKGINIGKISPNRIDPKYYVPRTLRKDFMQAYNENKQILKPYKITFQEINSDTSKLWKNENPNSKTNLVIVIQKKFLYWLPFGKGPKVSLDTAKHEQCGNLFNPSEITSSNNFSNVLKTIPQYFAAKK